MFNLITMITSIALLAVLGGATLYFMGDTPTDAAREAKVAALVSSSSQIQGALEMRTSDTPAPLSNMTELVPQYLSTIPAGDWQLNADGLVSFVDTEEQCKIFNKQVGYGEVAPACDDPAYSSKTVCCLTTP